MPRADFWQNSYFGQNFSIFSNCHESLSYVPATEVNNYVFLYLNTQLQIMLTYVEWILPVGFQKQILSSRLQTKYPWQLFQLSPRMEEIVRSYRLFSWLLDSSWITMLGSHHIEHAVSPSKYNDYLLNEFTKCEIFLYGQMMKYIIRSLACFHWQVFTVLQLGATRAMWHVSIL